MITATNLAGHVGNYNTFGKTANIANAHEKPVVWLEIWQLMLSGKATGWWEGRVGM